MRTRILFFSLLFFFPIIGSSQLIVDGNNLNEMDLPFITVVLDINNLRGQGINIHVDYGQELGGLKYDLGDCKITDDEGARLKFDGYNSAVYYIISQGWEVIDWQYISSDQRWIYRMKESSN